jgi:uncharacterized repeat protein (TIGR01451 family)
LLVLSLTGCALLDAILIQIGLERLEFQNLAGPDATVLVTPGGCVNLPNPVPSQSPIPGSEGAWQAGDAFSVESPPPWLSIATQRGVVSTTRQLCATADAPLVTGQRVQYSYIGSAPDQRTDGDPLHVITTIFSGVLRVSTVAATLAVNPTATPPVVERFDSSRLDAGITGGAPPFIVRWTPANLIDGVANTPSVVADPGETTTTYTVQVTDAAGVTVSGTVTVQVLDRPDIRITADPPRNGGWDPGTRVHLTAVVTDGTPPFTYAWSPTTGLDDPTRPDPSFTTPAFGTPDFNYTVTVTDAAGLQKTDFIVMHARVPLTISPQATPASVTPGQSSQLMANAAAPPFTTFTYQWSGAGLSATDIANPVATPTATTTYSVAVTDVFGRTGTASVTVTVRNGPDLAVSIVDSPDPAARNALLTYTATVTNIGTDAATGVVFTETMPFMIETSGGTASQGTCSTTFNPVIRVSCNLGTIAVGGVATVTLSGFTFGSGVITNTATVTLTENDANLANNTATATTTFLAGPF